MASNSKPMLGNGFIEALNQCPKLTDIDATNPGVLRWSYSELLAQIPPEGDELKELEPDMRERGIRVENGIIHLPPGVDVHR